VPRVWRGTSLIEYAIGSSSQVLVLTDPILVFRPV
jgi:hypothetical protein